MTLPLILPPLFVASMLFTLAVARRTASMVGARRRVAAPKASL